MTYREAIQQLQSEVEIMYEKAGALRDVADMKEKAHWNLLREHYRSAYCELSELDNQLTDVRASMQLRSNV